MFTSLARSLSKSLGRVGQASRLAKTALQNKLAPKRQVLGGFAGRRLRGTSDITQGLKQAIQSRVLVRFAYSDTGEPRFRAFRTGSPHAIWREGSKTYVHVYVRPGTPSRSKASPPWRTFILSKVQDLELILTNPSQFQPEGSQFTLAPGWRPSWYSRQGRAPIALARP
jgi:hypothetical protein